MDTDHKSLKVLLVDDDPAMLRLLARRIQSAGYAVSTAEDGLQAIAQMEADPTDILLTDWEMPGMDGLELCRWVRRQNFPHYIYTLFLTGRSNVDDAILALEAGADDFIRKPASRNELLARMRAGARVLELEHRLRQAARCDGLTGLATQQAFYELAQKEWKRARRHYLPLTCVMLDIDYFKRINDTYGHPVGDEVIRGFARLLLENTRGNDLISRYGGEEFCVLLPETEERNACAWAERVRRRVAEMEIGSGSDTIRVTASFGVAQMLADTTNPAELVDLADQALLLAKQSGRNRVVAFQSVNDLRRLSFQPNQCIDSPFGPVTAGQVMTTVVAPLHECDTAGATADYFLHFRIGSAPVIDGDGRLVGILSEKDVMSIMVRPDWRETRLRDVMKTNVVCYDESTPVQKVHDFLTRASIRSVVVVSDERPVGIINRGSLVRWVSNLAKLRDAEQSGPDEAIEDDVASARALLQQTAQCVVDRSNELIQGLSPSEDLLPHVVSAASAIQELLNDLLACSSHAAGPSARRALDQLFFHEEIQPVELCNDVIIPLTGDVDSPTTAWFPPGCEPEIERSPIAGPAVAK